MEPQEPFQACSGKPLPLLFGTELIFVCYLGGLRRLVGGLFITVARVQSLVIPCEICC
jgi:hypothetical protein